MMTRLTTRLLPLLAALVLSHAAAATEEVVVYGTDTSLKTEAVAETVAAAMTRYVEELNDAQKDALDAELARLCEQTIQIAATNLPTRG